MSKTIRLINSMLATTGTAALSASDTRHPSYVKANAILTDMVEEFSSMEMWYNTSIRTLRPNAEGKILIPANTITCDPTSASKKYSIRGQYLFDNDEYTSNIGYAVECIVIEEIKVADLPPAAYQYLRARCRYEYFLDQDGGERKLRNYAGQYQQKFSELVAMNMKLMDVNFFNSPAYLNFIIRRQGAGGRGYYSGTGRNDVQIGTLGNYIT